MGRLNRRALLVGADGVARDDSWMEVFESQAGLAAIVQASGPDYPDALARALGYPAAVDPGLLISAPCAGYQLKVRW